MPVSPQSTPFKGESFPAYVLQRVAIARTPSPQCVPADPVKDGPSLIDCDATVLRNDSALLTPPLPQRRPRQRRPLPTAVVTPPQRPSLSDQLRAISNGAQTITAHLRTSYALPSEKHNGPLVQAGAGLSPSFHLEATTVHMTVGRLECRFPCPVQFASDCCSYLFQHPFQPKEVRMVMYYRDMRQLQLQVRVRRLKFRVVHALAQFGDDYQPANPQHWLTIVFATVSEAERVKQFLAPHMR